jgi:hypothetical protein
MTTLAILALLELAISGGGAALMLTAIGLS